LQLSVPGLVALQSSTTLAVHPDAVEPSSVLTGIPVVIRVALGGVALVGVLQAHLGLLAAAAVRRRASTGLVVALVLALALRAVSVPKAAAVGAQTAITIVDPVALFLVATLAHVSVLAAIVVAAVGPALIVVVALIAASSAAPVGVLAAAVVATIRPAVVVLVALGRAAATAGAAAVGLPGGSNDASAVSTRLFQLGRSSG